MRVKRTPFKRKAVKKRRNVHRRKYTRKLRVPRMRTALGNFPATKTVALRYVDTVALNPTSTGVATNVFRVNNIFDPDYTGIGHQPMYYDNYSAVYSQYRVNYATITMVALHTHSVNVSFSNQTAGTTTSDTSYFANNERAVRMFILREQTPTDFPTNLNTLIEEGNKNLVWRYAPQNMSAGMQTLRFSCWPHRQFDVLKKDDSLTATVSGGPSRECYFIAGVADLGGGYDPDNVKYQFIITYNVTFYNLYKTQIQN